MKKLLLVVAIVTMVCGAKAQEITWGVRAGLNVPKVRETIKEEDRFLSISATDYKSKIGFHLGVIADLGLSKSFYLQPGLYFTTKGAKYQHASDSKLNLSYLQLPILASYRLNLGGNAKLHINAGPYFALGVAGKYKSGENKMNAFGTDRLKRFDTGLAFGTGVSFGKIYTGLNYELGLYNISKGIYRLNNRNFNVSVGYNF